MNFFQRFRTDKSKQHTCRKTCTCRKTHISFLCYRLKAREQIIFDATQLNDVVKDAHIDAGGVMSREEVVGRHPQAESSEGTD